MRQAVRQQSALASAFVAWCAIIALHAIITQAFEVAWVSGNGAAFLFPSTCGYIWRGMKPGWNMRRKAKRRG